MAGVYSKGKEYLTRTALWSGSTTFKAMLVTPSYTYDVDHAAVSSISGNEIATISGYTGAYGGSGRKYLTTLASSVDNASDIVKLTADNLTWTSLAAGVTIRYVVIIKEITNDAGSIPIACIDLGADYSSNGLNFSITWSSNGVITLVN